MFVPGKSSVEVQSEVLDVFFLGKLDIAYVDRWARVFMGDECDLTRIHWLSFSTFRASVELRVGWFVACVMLWLDRCLWQLLQCRQQRWLW
jgi:hypothetical protein